MGVKLKFSSSFFSVLILLIILSLFFILPYFQIHFFGSGLGNSMYPTLKPGDLVLMVPYSILKTFNIKPKINDIVVYESPIDEDLVCHRIIEINNDRIITKGDFNNIKDPYIIFEEDIIAIVPTIFDIPLHIPLLGFVLYEINSNLSLKFLLLFILIFFEIFLITLLIEDFYD